jgi:hypothetical protein
MVRIDRIDFDRRLAVEREIDKAQDYLTSIECDFDDSDNYLIYPSLSGIKVYDLANNKVSLMYK